MANFTAAHELAVLANFFNATYAGAYNTIAQNAGSPATNIYVSLHNASPGDAGSQTTNETSYTNYARVAVARTTAGWVISGSTPTNAQNNAVISFPQCGASGDTITHYGIGLSSTGAGTLMAYGTIGAGPGYLFTCTSASPGVLTAPGSSVTLNQRASVYPVGPVGSLPSGLTEGTVYYCVNVSGTTFNLSATSSGSGINTATVGAGVVILQTPLVVSNLITPSFAANAINVYMD